MQSLLEQAKNVFSQNGEDGIIERIFSIIGSGDRLCCEFGAWDGIHLSNTRALLLTGWKGILIEGDVVKFSELAKNYKEMSGTTCICAMIDEAENSLQRVLQKHGFGDLELDFLSIDIDGLDYDVFRSLERMPRRPRLICVEVNAGHLPGADRPLPNAVARENVGQPLGCFVHAATQLGYRLICYTGNAFFLRKDIGHESDLPTLSVMDAYAQFLSQLSASGKEWLWLVNRGWVPPFHQFGNFHLTAYHLGLLSVRAQLRLLGKGFLWQWRRWLDPRIKS